MTAVLVTVFGGVRGGWAGALLSQPAAWTVPVAFTVTTIVSLATPSRVPRGTARSMVRLHTPEDLVLDRSALARDRSAQASPPRGDARPR
jgi:cation/acetate symporter